MREIFSYKKVITLPFHKDIPTVALPETLKDLSSYFDLIKENQWGRHQLLVILTEPCTAQNSAAKKRQYQILLNKQGIPPSDVDLCFTSLKENPIDAFISIGHCNFVITTPHFTIEAAAKLFTPQPELFLR